MRLIQICFESVEQQGRLKCMSAVFSLSLKTDSASGKVLKSAGKLERILLPQ